MSKRASLRLKVMVGHIDRLHKFNRPIHTLAKNMEQKDKASKVILVWTHSLPVYMSINACWKEWAGNGNTPFDVC